MAGGWVRTTVLFFAVSVPKFTRLSQPTRERSQFSIVDVLFRSGDIRDRSAKSSEIAPKKHVIRPPNFFGGGPPNFGPSFLNCTHFRSCGKVSRRSAVRPRRSRAEEKKKQQQNIRARPGSPNKNYSSVWGPAFGVQKR